MGRLRFLGQSAVILSSNGRIEDAPCQVSYQTLVCFGSAQWRRWHPSRRSPSSLELPHHFSRASLAKECTGVPIPRQFGKANSAFSNAALQMAKSYSPRRRSRASRRFEGQAVQKAEQNKTGTAAARARDGIGIVIARREPNLSRHEKTY
jgi:hypothetical protein